METSIYDFDTRFGPFEAFAPYAPFAPFAFPMLATAPLEWWVDTMLSTYSGWCDIAASAMVYPFKLPQSAAAPVASGPLGK
jgi:hypothetical protein